MKAPLANPGESTADRPKLSLDRDSQRALQESMERRDSRVMPEQYSKMHALVRQKFTQKAWDFVQDFGSLANVTKDHVEAVAAKVFDEMFKNGGNTPEREGAALFEVKKRLLNGETAPAVEPTPVSASNETVQSVAAVYSPQMSEPVNEPPTDKVEGVSPEVVADMKAKGHNFNGVGALENTSGGPEWDRLSDSLRVPRVTLESVKDAFKDAVEQGANPQWLLDGLNAVKQTSVWKASSLEELLKALEEANKAGLNLNQFEELMASANFDRPEITPDDVVAAVSEQLKAGALPEDLIRVIRGNGHGF